MLLVLAHQMIKYHPYIKQKKKKKIFVFDEWKMFYIIMKFFIIIRLYKHWLDIFVSRLLINGYKNIYSHNVCIMIFIRIVSMRVVNMWWFFMHMVSMRWFLWELLLLKAFLSWKRDYVYVWGCEFCGYAF